MKDFIGNRIFDLILVCRLMVAVIKNMIRPMEEEEY